MMENQASSSAKKNSCPRCGGAIMSGQTDLESSNNCPHCGQMILSSVMEGKPSGRRIGLLIASSGWIGSLLVHLVGILAMTGIAVGPAMLAHGPEVEVLLTEDVIGEQIGTGTPDLVMPLDQSRLVDLVDLGVESTLEVAPLSLMQTDAQRQFSALLTDEHSADTSLVGLGADWGGVRSPDGGDQTSFFGLTAFGGRFVYVIDSSGSMRGDRAALAKSEAIRSITNLSRKQKFFVIFYSNDFLPMPSEQLVHATDENLDFYMNWIQSVGFGGGTEPEDALLVALALGPDAIFFLSDGSFSEGIVDVIRNANKDQRAQIFTIAYHDKSGLELLQRIANENRGRCTFVSPPE